MKLIKLTLIIFVSTYLFGCATGAQLENMAYQGEQKIYSEGLKNNVTVASVLGGEKTNPLWTSQIDNESFSGAVKQSLLAQGLLSDNGKYKLEVEMLKVQQPFLGLDMKVTTSVQYILTDIKSKSIVLDEIVVAPYTATFNDAFAGIKRLRLANEGSGKKNIEGLLEKISELKINSKEISLAK